jgi:hypothetical protein
MRVTPGGVHEETSLILTNGLGKGRRTLLQDDVAPALGAGLGDVDLVAGVVKEFWVDDVALELGFADLTLDAAPVDSDITQILQKLLSTVLTSHESQEFRRVVNKLSPARSLNEDRVNKEGGNKGNVCLDATDAELDESTEGFPTGDFVRRPVATQLTKERIIECSS